MTSRLHMRIAVAVAMIFGALVWALPGCTSDVTVTATSSISTYTASYLQAHGILVLNNISTPGTPLADASIFTVLADGSNKKMLTGLGNQFPSWTPDGRIIFVSNRSGSPQIWIMNADGSNAHQIGDITSVTTGQMGDIERVRLATNGLIAFMHKGDGIWLMQSDGSNLNELVKFQLGVGDAPALAPSGTWLTFTQEGQNTPGHLEIWRISTDGTGLKQLTFTGDPDYPDANASAISPDETQVAIYTGVESTMGDNPTTWGHRNIALISSTGGTRTLLTSCQPETTLSAIQAMTPDQCLTSDNPFWSPDGQWIIYDRGSGNTLGSGVYAIDRNGNNIMRLNAGGIGGETVPITLTGIVQPATLTVMGQQLSLVPIVHALSLGMQGSEVSSLQNMLAKIGLFTGNITGYFGKVTQAAVMAFQNADHLAPVGTVGPQTRAALQQIGGR